MPAGDVKMTQIGFLLDPSSKCLAPRHLPGVFPRAEASRFSMEEDNFPGDSCFLSPPCEGGDQGEVKPTAKPQRLLLQRRTFLSLTVPFPQHACCERSV